MREFAFAIGDRVRLNGLPVSRLNEHDVGTVVSVTGYDVGVAWDRNWGGHDCHGCCENGHGYYMQHSQIVLCEETSNEIFEAASDDELQALFSVNKT